jgi:hypothetical protein
MWYKIIQISEWFYEMSARYTIIKNFNRAAKVSFIAGTAPTLLKVKISRGNSDFRHSFSKFLGGGFRIKALSGRPLDKKELIEIGRVVLDNEEVVRSLITNGWDTLEVHANHGYNGTQWKLEEYVDFGGFLD